MLEAVLALSLVNVVLSAVGVYQRHVSIQLARGEVVPQNPHSPGPNGLGP